MTPPAASTLRDRLFRSLGRRAAPIRKIIRAAVAHHAAPYLVGGPVRDLLLRRGIEDVDLLLPHSLDGVARDAARAVRGTLALHPRFLTASIRVGDLRIDLSQAREERYPSPGALPVVRPGAVAADLGRRDFTIQSMALPLHRDAGTELLDPFGGRADLRRGLLRVLHDESFVDDPTRMFRLARYAARFGFRAAPQTSRILRDAVRQRALDRVSGDRVVQELDRLLGESDPAGAARRTHALGLFAATTPGWRVGSRAARALALFVAAVRRPPWPAWEAASLRHECGLRILLLDAPTGTRPEILSRLAVRGRPARAIESDLSRLPDLRRVLARASRGAIDARLSGMQESALLLLHCIATGSSSRALRRYVKTDRVRRSPLDGHDARRLGAAGPRVGALLEAARRRALDGERVDASWAKRWLRSHR